MKKSEDANNKGCKIWRELNWEDKRDDSRD